MQPTPPKPPQPAPESPPAAALKAEGSQADVTADGLTKLDTSPQNYYQAIGWLRGKLVKDEEERFGVQIRDVTFPLYLPRRVVAVANKLLEQMVWMKCYPQSKGEGLSFKAVWMGSEQTEKGEPGIFVLRGVWQFIPQCRRPVFSIYRNELKNYENRPTNQHLPLIWADQPPYRFRKDSEERPKFYQIIARLIPQRGCFGFVSQIADPIEQTPKRVKKPPLAPPASGGKAPKPKPVAKSEDAEAPVLPLEDSLPSPETALEEAREGVMDPSPVTPIISPEPDPALSVVPGVLAEATASQASEDTVLTLGPEADAVANTVPEPENRETEPEPIPVLPELAVTEPDLPLFSLESPPEPEPEASPEAGPATKGKRTSKSTGKNTTKTKTSRKKSAS